MTMNGTTPSKQEIRDGYADGLEALARALRKHRDVPLPHDGSVSALTIHFLSAADPRAEMAAAAKAIPCDWVKHVRSYDSGDSYFDLDGKLHGLKITLTAFRDAVCERVVTGTREVTEKVKDPEALAAVPEVEVTRTVEDVEWICGSVLAPSRNGSVQVPA